MRTTMTFMTYEQIQKMHQENQSAAWKHAHDVAVVRFIDEGYSLANAIIKADDLMFEINWTLAHPEPTSSSE